MSDSEIIKLQKEEMESFYDMFVFYINESNLQDEEIHRWEDEGGFSWKPTE